MAFCKSCGTNVGDAAFCNNCGAPQKDTNESQAPPVAQSQQFSQPQPAAPVTINVNTATLGPPCPKCHSQSTELAAVKNKRLSGGKIAAGVMTGGFSLLATGISSTQKVDWVCKVCGNSFTIKA